MLLKLGLEVQMRLLPFNKVMSYNWTLVAKTTDPGKYAVPAIDYAKYSISDIFLGLVMAISPNPM